MWQLIYIQYKNNLQFKNCMSFDNKLVGSAGNKCSQNLLSDNCRLYSTNDALAGLEVPGYAYYRKMP